MPPGIIRFALATLVALTVCASSQAQDLQITKSRKSVKTLTQTGLRQALPQHTVTVQEPHEGRPRSYRGVRFTDVLKLAYGRLPKSGEAVLCRCRDGFTPLITAEYMQSHQGYLVFASGDKNAFDLHSGKIKLTPYYLVWDNLKGSAEERGDANLWPYQVVALDLIPARLPSLEPPPGSPASVGRGYRAYQHNCMACHSFNGVGGRSAPDLAGKIRTRDKEWLARFIDKPASLDPHTTMPGLMEMPQRAQVIGEIVQYLKAVDVKAR